MKYNYSFEVNQLLADRDKEIERLKYDNEVLEAALTLQKLANMVHIKRWEEMNK